MQQSDASGGHGLRYAITVDFELEVGARERFMELIGENAAASVRDEPGCLRFDVLTPRKSGGGADRVFLYEIYADHAAFEAHLATPHFAAFDEQSRALVKRKAVAEFDVAENY